MAAFVPSEDHIRHCMLFHFHAGLNAAAATRKICDTYGEVLEVNKCQSWYRKFAAGDYDLNDMPRSGRPVQFDEDALKSLVEADPRLTIQELSRSLQSTWSTVQRHLHQIGKKCRQGVWTPHELSESNKDQRRTICTSLLTRLNSDPFLNRIVTGDEKWILYDNVKRSRQWLSANQAPRPTSRPTLTMRKVLLSIWWDCSGIIHFELLRPGETITADSYCSQLERLQSKLIEKRPALINRRGVILQHDNARPHTARITQEKIKELGWEVLLHPPYSPDIAPSDYHLFRSLEHSLRNKTFNSATDDERHLQSYFASRPADFYRNGIENLRSRWRTVIDNDGDYIID